MRYLGLYKKTHQQWLEEMSQSKYLEFENDSYNQGALVDQLENRVNNLLGKQSSLFFNKGVTAQLAAMKVVCDARNNNLIALHPQSHIILDEEDAYQTLLNLKSISIGKLNQSIIFDDLKSINVTPAILILELPLRRAGFKLPEWNELLKIRTWCDANHVHLHMDGARLWESAPYYSKSFAEISSLFDSVYVSLYKGIGAISGAVLAGTNDFTEKCKPWRVRLGSHLWTTFPSLITSLDGLDSNLPQIPSWVNRAKTLAGKLQEIDKLIVDTPQCNSFQVRIRTDNLIELNSKLVQLESGFDIKVCRPFSDYSCDSSLKFTEVQVGASHQSIDDKEIVRFFSLLTKSL